MPRDPGVQLQLEDQEGEGRCHWLPETLPVSRAREGARERSQWSGVRDAREQASQAEGGGEPGAGRKHEIDGGHEARM